MDFTRKVVLIAGASSGIGAVTAKEFAKLNANLSIVGRNQNALTTTATECEKISPCQLKPMSIIADVTHEADVNRIFAETMACYQQLNVLVNACGILEPGTIFDTCLDQLNRTMRTNVHGMYVLTKLCMPELIRTKDNIVNISSVCGLLRAFPNVLAYNMSKSAVDQFTRCVAIEVGTQGVRVNAVNPGVIETQLHKRGGMEEAEYKKFLERAKETHALGRHGQPIEVANAIVFLASELASFITAVTLSVDGGRQAMCPR